MVVLCCLYWHCFYKMNDNTLQWTFVWVHRLTWCSGAPRQSWKIISFRRARFWAHHFFSCYSTSMIVSSLSHSLALKVSFNNNNNNNNNNNSMLIEVSHLWEICYYMSETWVILEILVTFVGRELLWWFLVSYHWLGLASNQAKNIKLDDRLWSTSGGCQIHWEVRWLLVPGKLPGHAKFY